MNIYEPCCYEPRNIEGSKLALPGNTVFPGKDAADGTEHRIAALRLEDQYNSVTSFGGEKSDLSGIHPYKPCLRQPADAGFLKAKDSRIRGSYSHDGGRARFSMPEKDELKGGETFRQMLLRLMNEKDMSAPMLYTEACMDRKLFSKIQSSDAYQPRKYTVVRLALALQLSLGETDEFLRNAGFALSRSKMTDLVIAYCIEHDKRSVGEVNEILEAWDLATI